MKGSDPVASKTKPIRNALVWKTCLRILKPSISDDLSTETFDNEWLYLLPLAYLLVQT